jgi:hypothetical protein
LTAPQPSAARTLAPSLVRHPFAAVSSTRQLTPNPAPFQPSLSIGHPSANQPLLAAQSIQPQNPPLSRGPPFSNTNAAPTSFKPPAVNFAVTHMMQQQQMQARAAQRGFLLHPQQTAPTPQQMFHSVVPTPMPQPYPPQSSQYPMGHITPSLTPPPMQQSFGQFGPAAQPIPYHSSAAATFAPPTPSTSSAGAGGASYSGMPSVFTASKLNTKHRLKDLSASGSAGASVPSTVSASGAANPGAAGSGVGSLGTGKKDRKANAASGTANLRIRLWDGSELRHEFLASEMLSTVVNWVAQQPVYLLCHTALLCCFTI